METEPAARAESLAQLITAIRDSYSVSLSEIARRIDVSPATVSTWASGKRGTGRGPNRDNLRKLSQQFPAFSEDRIFAAAGRQAPGPLSPDAEQRILELYRELTREQQEITETQMRALAERNQTAS